MFWPMSNMKIKKRHGKGKKSQCPKCCKEGGEQVQRDYSIPFIGSTSIRCFCLTDIQHHVIFVNNNSNLLVIIGCSNYLVDHIQ